MTALKVIAVILLLFVLLCLVRIGAVVCFGEETVVSARIGLLRIKVFPGKEKSGKEKKPSKKKKEPTESAEVKEKKKLPKLTASEVVDLIKTALRALRASLRRLKLRIDPLRLSVRIAGSDPADVAQNFGYLNAAVWGVMPEAERVLDIPDPRIHLEMDFAGEKTTAEGTVGISLRIGTLLTAGIVLLIPMLKWYLRYRKAHRGQREAEPKEETNHQKMSA